MSNIEKRTGASLARHRSAQDIGTPPEFIEAISRRFGPIVFDLAANADNAVCAEYYGPGSKRAEDSLIAPWMLRGKARTGLLYLNPPFGFIEPWAIKCAQHHDRCGFIVLLVPSATGANWFQRHVVPNAYVLELTDRLTFVGSTQPYPKDLVAAVFGHSLVGRASWHWDTSKRKTYERSARKASE